MVVLVGVGLAVVGSVSPRLFEVVTAESRVDYEIEHTLHEVKGESRGVEGKLALRSDGKAQVMVRIAVVSFRSGDANRDVHLLEVVEGAKYPYVVLKAALPARLPEAGSAALSLMAQLDFHGQKQMVAVPIEITKLPDERWKVKSVFTISLDAFGVERPSLLFVKLPDPTVIRVNLILREVRK